MNLRRVSVGGAAALVVHAAALAAQADTARTLDPLVVTADRASTPLSASTSSVTRITDSELARTPGPTLAAALQRVPGFAVLDFDGAGFDPQVVVRGFYGGGEAEYVVVLVDGRPVNQLQTGLVPWDALPPAAAIQDVEVVRGSESALYGDAALGAVINVITRRPEPGAPLRWDAGTGAFGLWTADADLAVGAAGHDITGSAGFDRTGGFRAHAARDAFRAQVDAPLVATATTTLTFGVRTYLRAFDEPGPLLASQLAQDRAASDEFFRFDHTRDASTTVSLNGDRQVGDRMHLMASLAGELRNTSAVQTLALSPDFGNTQQRQTDNQRASAVVQLTIDHAALPGGGRLTIGTDLGDGWLDSRYYAVASGSRDDYGTATGARGALDASGDGGRASAAVFGEYAVMVDPAVRLSLGSRYDWLRDTFDPRAPDQGDDLVASHDAFSPKAGLNVRYQGGPGGSGHVYVTAGRSFKAPTLDQLFDQRPIPVPFPPYSVTTSNPLLQPQTGTSLETGLYQDGALSREWRGSASLSVYQMDMKNELDFDVQTLRYINIGSSRHRGIEAGVVLSGPGGASLFANYTLQAVTSQSGDDIGKQLKAIPRHTVSGGVTVVPLARLEVTAIVTTLAGAYLDDANMVALPAFTRVDARTSYPVGAVSIVLEARNLFGAQYNTTGYLDPSGSGEAYFYPAAGRALSVGLRGGW